MTINLVRQTVVPGVTQGEVPAAGIAGRIDGSSVPAGSIFEQPAPYTSSALLGLAANKDAYVDITGVTLPLNPGIFILIGQATIQFGVSGGTANTDGLVGSVAIRNASTNAVIAETVVATAMSTNLQIFGSAPVIATVNITAATTYKLSDYFRTISAAVTINQNNIRGDYQPTKLFAIRIG